ncbi:MAG: preQ(1) synthase [Alphaproteobacteria bacterium]|nr:preQ(1) synthase [Alphaproteobacteria bacterium]
MIKSIYKNLVQLGKETPVPSKPEKALLERVKNPHSAEDYLIRFSCPEFTSVCPVTGQPDFAHIIIDYVPSKYLIESKSIKLYFQSFRNFGAFHEACTMDIGTKLYEFLEPKWMRISGYWYPRGGITIDIFFEKGELPKNVSVPDTNISAYRGR